MGHSLTCVSCVAREDEDHSVKPLMTPRESEESTRVPGRVEDSKPCVESPGPVDDELQSHINAIFNASKNRPKQSPAVLKAELQDRISAAQLNAIVNTYSSPCKQSPVWCSSDDELQDQINAIVGAHSKSLKDQRLSLTDPSPSPARSFSDAEFEQYASLVLSQAKERNTPSKSPSSMHWATSTCQDEFKPCQLNFGDFDDAVTNDKDKDVADAALSEPEPAPRRAPQLKVECSTDAPKGDTCTFDVKDIPSPTRNRAKRQQMLLAAAKKDEASVESAVQPKEEEEEDEQKALVEVGEVEQRRKAAEEEAAARMKEIQHCSMSLQEIEEKAQLEVMDKICVEAFLRSVKKCSIHNDRVRTGVRTPLKGTNLYTKHMRPCRAPGTSVDVKDSSFRTLGTFLQFLESEGLLHLQPGLTDPVVNEIRLDACRKYKYDPRRALPYTANAAPHDEGCSCRLCPSHTTTTSLSAPFEGFRWQ